MAGSKAKARTFDFTGVEDRTGSFRPKRKPSGDYYAHIKAVQDFESKEGNDGWVFTITVDGDARSSYPYYVMFEQKQAWKPRALCVAAGIKVPQSKVKLDPNKLVGKAIGIALEDDEFEGRVKSTIDAIFPLDELSDAQNAQGKTSSAKAKSRDAEDDDEDDEDEDDEPAPAKRNTKKRAPEPEDDEDEDDDEDDEPPVKSKKAAAKGKGKKKPEPDDEDDDDDDDEDEEPPAKKKSKASTKSKKKSKSDDDDDDELDLDDL